VSEYEEEYFQSIRPQSQQIGEQENASYKILARLFIEVQEAVDKQKKIEAEVAGLKSSLEASATSQEIQDKGHSSKESSKDTDKEEGGKKFNLIPEHWKDEFMATGEYVLVNGIPEKIKTVAYVSPKYLKIREESLAKQKKANASKISTQTDNISQEQSKHH